MKKNDFLLNAEISNICHEFKIKDVTYSVAIANDIKSREQSYNFIYQNYREKGFGFPDSSELYFSIDELLPQTTTIMILQKQTVVASVSTISDSAFGLPADNIFNDTLNRMRAQGYRVSQIFSLAINADNLGKVILISKLFNFILIINQYIFNNDHCVITIRPHHSQFYINKLLFQDQNITGFHKKVGTNVSLLINNMTENLEIDNISKQKTLFKYFMPDNKIFKIIGHIKEIIKPIDQKEMEYFYKKKPKILDNLNPTQQAYVEEILKSKITIFNKF